MVCILQKQPPGGILRGLVKVCWSARASMVATLGILGSGQGEVRKALPFFAFVCLIVILAGFHALLPCLSYSRTYLISMCYRTHELR